LDSFWYNAVEAEVYAMASLFIALLFWLGLRWEQDMDKPRGNKWLLIISLVVGLSFGVHFMALLTILQ
jgi:4-amino-4-deoxy-L-arabinose transferase-like glycosyltransferase